MTARVAPVPPPARPGDTVMVDGHPMVVVRLLPHLRGLRRTFLVSKHPRRLQGALGLPWRPPACRFRPAARSPAGAPAIGRRAATTGPRPMASVPTPRPELPAAGGVRNRPVERGGGVPHVDGTGDRGMAHRCRRRDSLDRASAASTPPARGRRTHPDAPPAAP